VGTAPSFDLSTPPADAVMANHSGTVMSISDGDAGETTGRLLCTDKNARYSTVFNFVCGKTSNEARYATFDPDTCSFTAQWSSPHACPVCRMEDVHRLEGKCTKGKREVRYEQVDPEFPCYGGEVAELLRTPTIIACDDEGGIPTTWLVLAIVGPLVIICPLLAWLLREYSNYTALRREYASLKEQATSGTDFPPTAIEMEKEDNDNELSECEDIQFGKTAA